MSTVAPPPPPEPPPLRPVPADTVAIPPPAALSHLVAHALSIPISGFVEPPPVKYGPVVTLSTVPSQVV